MLSLAYTVIKYALEYKASSKEDKADINDVIARIESAYKNDTVEGDVCLSNDDAYQDTGIITFTATDYVLIDDRFVCDIVNVPVNNIKVGDKVHYLAYQEGQKKEQKVRKIISVINESWDNADTESQGNISKPQEFSKSLVGIVERRENRQLYIAPNNVMVDLNKVKSEFIPVIGDWLKLEAVIEINEDSTDLAGKVLEITRIQPLRSKLDIGTITSYDPVKEIGTIGKNIVFNKRVCDSGYIPCIGDKVVSDSIESNQGVYSWRSLTIVPVMQVSGKQAPLSRLFTDQITKKNLNELVKDKYGVLITNDLNVNLNVQAETTLTLTIKNVGNDTHVLRKTCFMSTKSQSQLELLQPVALDNKLILNPSNTVSYVFKCKAKFVGVSEELVIFNFEGFDIGRVFHITVNVKNTCAKGIVGSYNNNYRNKKYYDNFNDNDQSTYIPGVRPYNPPKFIKVRNAVFRVPKQYWDVVLRCTNVGKSPIESEEEIGSVLPCLLNGLTFQTYKERFHALLYLEEIARSLDMQQYDMQSAIMRRCGEYLVMQVPGLAEKRPSLLVGDRAVVSFKWDDSQGKMKYEGFIHKVSNSEIFLKFNQRFQDEYNNEDCQVTFKCSQSAIQRCHNAINMALNHLGPYFLFPTHVIEKEPQLYLEENEIKDNPNHTRSATLNHKRTNSASSESSANATSTSNSTNKSFTKLSVIERLFNVKPVEQSTVLATGLINTTESIRQVETTLNIGSNSINIPLLGTTNEMSSVNKESAELEPYISQVKKRKLQWYNKNLNYYQKEAVRNILEGRARPLPYVIFGPPGTGKTVTLCETILQILSTVPESRLLIATPSNSSANLITERLLDSGILKPGDMVRLIAHHCIGSDCIPDKLLPYCATAELAEEGTSEKRKHTGVGPKLSCTISVLGRHRITIGTCIALGILYNMGFPHGHFSHVLVDEAGQATEPEIMIPLNFIHSEYGQVILAGDPLQLGPVVQSRLAKNFGLGESFLTRLLRHFPYQRDPHGFERLYDSRLVTKLVMNYRSLPEILELPSSLFYDSELEPQISPKRSNEAKLLQTLTPIFPEREGSPPAIIFHGVNGENCQDNDSPSWYNPQEATQVYLYLLKFYECGLSPNDIGIITPYQKQVFQIRDLLLELNIKLPKISSVEGFQGQERNVIIISTVRSSDRHVTADIKHSLGFVACPRRLNVAITRARVLLLILGNPQLLDQDPYWRSVLKYCIDRGAYTGCNFFI